MWAAQSCFRIGEYHIGVRSSTRAADAALRRIFAAHVVDDPKAPPNYSVVYPEGEGDQGVYRLYSGSTTVMRARSAARITRAVIDVLGSLAQPEAPSLIPISVRPLIKDGEAVLTPVETVYALDLLEPRLRRMGIDYMPHGRPMLDPETGELVLLEPDLAIDGAVIDELARGNGSAALPPNAGRFRIRAWIFFGTNAQGAPGPLSPASAIAMALKAVYHIADHGSQRVLDGLASVFAGPGRAMGTAVDPPGGKALAEAIKTMW